MSEFFETIKQVDGWLLLVSGGGLSFFLKLFINQLQEKNTIRKQEKELVDRRLKSVEFANLAILHNKIYRQCAEHLDAGFISIDDLDDLEYLFNAYKNLGGNGTGETLYNKVKNLPNNMKKEGK